MFCFWSNRPTRLPNPISPIRPNLPPFSRHRADARIARPAT
jgi:hypothetical protein